MIDINFITSNKGKLATATEHLSDSAYRVRAHKLDIIEIQANSVEEIVRAKALEAKKQVPLPLMVHDSGVSVKSLGGFPGPYAKYVEDTIGLDKLSGMIGHGNDRSCSITKSLAFIDKSGKLHIFSHEYRGSIAQKPMESESEYVPWSLLYTVFIPEGYAKPLSQFTDNEMTVWQKTAGEDSEFSQLRAFLKTP